jgi:tetratricopeptide (TPR) repeat protein
VRRGAIPLLLVLLAGAGAGAIAAATEPPQALFDRAGAAYREGKFDEAAKAYESILADGVDDARVHYNLANAYFKLGRLGPAILEYERCLRLDPSDDEARDNLALARGLLRDKMSEPELQYPVRVLKETIESLPSGVLAGGFLVFWFVAWGTAGFVPVTASWVRRRLLGYGACALGLVALTFGAALLYQMRQESAGIGIVMADRVDVRSGPGEGNTVLFTVHEGTRMELRHSVEAWTQVSLPNGLSGWVPARSVERV